MEKYRQNQMENWKDCISWLSQNFPSYKDLKKMDNAPKGQKVAWKVGQSNMGIPSKSKPCDEGNNCNFWVTNT